MQAASLALALVLGTGEPQGVLYDFGGPRCFHCQVMNPIVDRLIEEGLPIVKVNCDENRDLPRQFNVHSLPTFILVVNGQEVERCVGQQTEAHLRQMVARIPEPEPEREPQRTAHAAGSAVQAPSSAAPPPSNHIQLGPSGPFPGTASTTQPPRATAPPAVGNQIIPASPPSTPPTQGLSRDRTQPPSMEYVVAPQQDEPPVARGNSPEVDAAPSATPSITSMAASVRIRVIHGGRVNLGSGTLILSQQGRSLIITCGHLFRDLASDAKIEVDVFANGTSQTYVGTLLDFDIEAEVGLVTINSDQVLPTVKIAPANAPQQAQERVASIGCSGGEAPSREQLRITAINKYVGPDTIECTGTPVQGRSGGGLFNANEELIGVCFSAGIDSALGLYAGPRAMYAMLDKYELAYLYTPATADPAQSAAHVADAAPATPPSGNGGSQAQSAPPPIDLGVPSSEPFVSRQEAPEPAVWSDSVTTTEAPLDFDAGDAEVVCLITEADGSRRVVVLNRASPKFVAYLNGELGDDAISISEVEPQPTTTVMAQRMPRPAATAMMTFASAAQAPAARPYTMQGFQPTSLVQPMTPRAYVRQR